MKKAKTSSRDPEMRADYKRSDFAYLERGKFFKEASAGMTVALIDPALAKIFPDSKAVNAALRGLIEMSTLTTRLTASARGRGVRRTLAAG